MFQDRVTEKLPALVTLAENLYQERKQAIMNLRAGAGPNPDDRIAKLSPEMIDTEETKDLEVPTLNLCLTKACAAFVPQEFKAEKLLDQAFSVAKAEWIKRKDAAAEKRAEKKRKADDALTPDPPDGSVGSPSVSVGDSEAAPSLPTTPCALEDGGSARLGANDPMAALAAQCEENDEGPETVQPPLPEVTNGPGGNDKAPAAADAMDTVREDVDAP